MANFPSIDKDRPQGNEKGNVLDDMIRETRTWAENVFGMISGYPDQVAVILPIWTTGTRPVGVLKEFLMGYNTDLKQLEVVQNGQWGALPLVSTDAAMVAGCRFTISDTAPASPVEGKEFWVDTANNCIKIFKNGGWAITGAAYQ